MFNTARAMQRKSKHTHTQRSHRPSRTLGYWATGSTTSVLAYLTIPSQARIVCAWGGGDLIMVQQVWGCVRGWWGRIMMDGRRA